MRNSELSLRLTALLVALLAVLAATLALSVPARAAQATTYLQIVKASPDSESALDGGVEKETLINAHFQVRELEGLDLVSTQELGDFVLDRPELLTVEPGVDMGEAVQARTDNSGVALFTGLDHGIYQVVELSRRTNDSPELLSTPFLVAVDGARTVVSTKIQPLVVDKQVTPARADWGDEVVYTISASIPQVDINGNLAKAEFADKLDSRLDFTAVRELKVSNLKQTVNLDTTDYQVSVAAGEVVVALTSAGLRRLAELRAGHPETRVSFRLVATVNTPLFPGAKISNTAFFAPDGFCPATTYGRSCPHHFSAIPSNAAVVEAPVLATGTALIAGTFLAILSAVGLLAWLREPAWHIFNGEPPAQDESTLVDEIESKLGELASTGANIWWMVAIALLLLVVGILLVSRRRRPQPTISQGILRRRDDS